jgi:flagellar biosynthesis chaperone FliJ
MMKKRNPFNVLVRLRSIEEKQARASLANTRHAHEQARRKLEELKERHREDIDVGEILGAVNLRSLQLRGLGSLEMVNAAAQVYKQSERALYAKSEAWRRSAADLDAAERLDEKKKQEVAREAAKTAEKSLDDLMGMLHSRSGDGLI